MATAVRRTIALFQGADERHSTAAVSSRQQLTHGTPASCHSASLEFRVHEIPHTWNTSTLEFYTRITADGDARLR
jgi:hypothetical protein